MLLTHHVNVLPTWTAWAEVFGEERSLPDGRVERPSAEAWQRVHDFLCSSGWRLDLVRDGESQAIPVSAPDLFDGIPTLKVWIAEGIQINVFPNAEDVLFDFDSAEVSNDEELQVLLGFLKGLAMAAAKPVLVSHEGAWERVFLAYYPDQDEFAWSA